MRPRRRSRSTAAALAITVALAVTVVACGPDGDGQRVSGTATNTSAPGRGGTIASAGDPGPGPTSLAGVNVRLTTVATVDHPVAMAARAGTDDLYVAGQGGRVQVLRVADSTPTKPELRIDPIPALDLTAQTHADGERGLLGITFSPDGQQLVADYTDLDGNTLVVAYPMQGDVADPSQARELLVQTQPFPNHNGGQVVYGPDGYLYIGLGDGGGAGDPNGNGQNTSTLLGKILRIDPGHPGAGRAYAIPVDNPFASGSGGAPEAWLYGVRNPWRFTFDRTSGDLWVGDVGQDHYEEIDLLPAADGSGRGANLGWNLMEGTHAYQGGAAPAGAVAPILDYDHTGGNCAVIGGYVYRGQAIPALQGTYVFGDYCLGELRGLLQRNGTSLDERSLGPSLGQGLRSFGQDDHGELYALLESGPILRIEPA